jgi:hypothetical protein
VERWPGARRLTTAKRAAVKGQPKAERRSGKAAAGATLEGRGQSRLTMALVPGRQARNLCASPSGLFEFVLLGDVLSSP